MPEPMFQTLFDATGALAWAPVDAIRERARRRARRAVVATAATAMLAVGLIAAGVAATRNVHRGPPVAPLTPTPVVTVTDDGFLRPEDIGTGYRELGFEDETSGPWTFHFTMSMLNCPPAQTPPMPDIARARSLGRGTRPAEDHVVQYIFPYRPGDADRSLADVRARVAACRPGNGGSITIGAERFAGQDSLLLVVHFGDGSTLTLVHVRQGDLVTELWAKPERSVAEYQELGRTAALRLCQC